MGEFQPKQRGIERDPVPFPPDAPRRQGPVQRGLFRVLPSWLRGALGLKDGAVPGSLDVSAVRPYIDAYQGGFAVARFLEANFALTAAVQNTIALPADFAVVRRLLYVSIAVNVLAADRSFSGLLFRPDSTLTGVRPFDVVAPAGVAGQIGSNRILGGQPQIIPPGFALLVQCQLAAAETCDVRMVWAEAAQGFSLAL